MPISRNRLLKINTYDISNLENNLNLSIGEEMCIVPLGKYCDAVAFSPLMIRFQNLTLLIHI